MSEETKILTPEQVQDPLEQQLVNELLHIMKQVNEKYKDFFHIQLLTLVGLTKEQCTEIKCVEEVAQCTRAVVGVHKCGPENITEQLMEEFAPVKDKDGVSESGS